MRTTTLFFRAVILTMLHCSNGSAASQLFAQGVRFERVSVEQGLSSANVNFIVQDRNKMLWFGTEDGLNRYDGAAFTTFRQMLPDSLGTGTQSVLSVFADKNDFLWLATGNKRCVSRFSPYSRRFEALVFPQNIETFTRCFAETSDGTVLIGTKNGVFAALLSASAKSINVVISLQRLKSIPENLDVQAMVRDSGDILWVSAKNDLYRFNTHTNILSKVQSGIQGEICTMIPHIDSASQPRPSLLWIGTKDDGLYAYFPASKRLLHFPGEESLPSKHVRTVCSVKPDEVWVGTESGITVLNRIGARSGLQMQDWQITQQFTHDLRNDRTLSGNLVQHVSRDASGVVWVGTAYYGVSKYSPYKQKFRHFAVNLLKENASLNSGFVRDIAEEGDNLWLATQTGGLNRYNRRNGVWTYYRQNAIGSDTAWALKLDRKGVLWLGCVGSGLWKWNPQKQVFERFAAIPASSSIQILYEDSEGTLWANGENTPLYAISPDRVQVRAIPLNLANTSRAVGRRVLSALETAHGQFLLGLPTGLVELDRSTGAMKQILAQYVVRSMLQTTRGDIWFGTRGQGLLRYRQENGTRQNTRIDAIKEPQIGNDAGLQIRAVTERDGLPSNLVSAMLEDSRKRLWVSTKQGIAQIDLETEKVWRAFDIDDGLQGREFHQGSALKTPRGEMFFGGTNGFNSFFPEQVMVNDVPPPVQIVSVKKFGRDEMLDDSLIAANRSITLRHDENTLTFSFVALDFNTPEANTYSYHLQGLDKGWTNCGTRREATYTSLDAGEYLFSVRAANNDGTWNNEGASFRIVVTPPIWRTWWFIGLSVASSVCVGFVLYRMRIRGIEARNIWLEKQVEERTAEIQEKNEELQQSLDDIKILTSVLEGERNKSDELLLNILPPSIAERLKWGETTIVDTFPSATVIFTDMVGFTKIAAKVSPEELIEMLNQMFSTFDKLAEKHNVEKIKTIGDAYMAVAGVPIPRDDHAESVAAMSLDIMAAIQEIAEKEKLPIQIRAGIHTGYLTAGVIGEKKFAYDLWGDTVNTASRMESSGEAGKVQCSEATYQALKDLFDFEERGTIEVKGKGAMKTYFLVGRKAE